MNLESVFYVAAATALIYFVVRLPTNWKFVKWDRQKLIRFLESNDIYYHAWQYYSGAGSLDRLLSSLQTGEMWIEERDDPGPILHINVAVTTIRFRRNGEDLVLREFREQAKGKFVERRFSGSVGGKFSTSIETAQQAARREIREELHISEADMYYFKLTPVHVEISHAYLSEFYPGFRDVYERHLFDCEMPTFFYRTHYSHTTTNNVRVEHRWVREEDQRIH